MTNVFQAPVEPRALKAMELVDEELFVDLNQAIQESLDKTRERLGQLNAIIRCDKLPHVQANAKDIKQLIDYLINLILLYPPQNSKLFIYIKGNQFHNSLPVGSSSRQLFYEISFHTNSCNEATWQNAHQREIAACTAICTQYSGVFTAAHGHAECLFKLTLPGKLF